MIPEERQTQRIPAVFANITSDLSSLCVVHVTACKSSGEESGRSKVGKLPSSSASAGNGCRRLFFRFCRARPALLKYSSRKALLTEPSETHADLPSPPISESRSSMPLSPRTRCLTTFMSCIQSSQGCILKGKVLAPTVSASRKPNPLQVYAYELIYGLLNDL